MGAFCPHLNIFLSHLKNSNLNMKSILTLFFFAILIKSNAQNALVFNYNTNQSGRNTSFVFSKTLNNKHEFGGGIRYNINSIMQPDDQSNIFRKRLFATKPYQHFGVHGFYSLSVFQKLTCVKPFVFYDIQAAYSTTRSSLYIPVAITNDGMVLYKNSIPFFGPYTWLEQYIGCGFKAIINKSFFITQKTGLGALLILGKESRTNSHILARGKVSCEVALTFNMGFGYCFPNKSK